MQVSHASSEICKTHVHMPPKDNNEVHKMLSHSLESTDTMQGARTDDPTDGIQVDLPVAIEYPVRIRLCSRLCGMPETL